MPSNCDIEFDHSNGVYHSGENFNGTIKLTTGTSKTVRGVHITINGYAKVKWDERKSRQRNGKTEYYTVTYRAHDQYLNSRTYVVGIEGGSSFELAPGAYNHTFTCPLPISLPTSVVGKYGEIKYEVIVTVDRPYRFDNVFKRGFTVIQELNLNLNPEYKMPKYAIDHKEFCCTCCCFGGAGTVQTKLEIPYGGYAPGQKINFTLYVFNDSANDLESCKVKLEKRIIFEARTPSVKHRYSEFEIDSKRFPDVLRLTRKQFQGFLEIPSVPPSSTLASACVRIDYALHAKVITGCCHNNINLSIPITMGTIPLLISATNPANVITVQPTAPIPTGTENDDNVGGLPPGYKTVAPPSYEDAIVTLEQFADDERDDKHQEAPFVPKYPVYYNFAQPTAPPPSYPHDPATTVPAQQPSAESATTYGWDTRT